MFLYLVSRSVKNKHILTVTLNPAIDQTIVVDRLKVGKDSLSQKNIISAGGKGVNIARSLQHLGAAVVATGFTGGDDGKQLEQLCNAENIHQQFFLNKENTRRNMTIIDKSCITRIMGCNPKISKTIFDRFKKHYEKLLKNCEMVIIAGRKIEGLGSNQYTELLTLAHQKNIITILDTHGAILKSALKSFPDLIKPNINEAEELCSMKIKSLKHEMKALSKMIQMGAKNVCLTKDSKYSLGCDGENIWKIPHLSVEVINHVGCGDAFVGGFAFARSRGWSFDKCCSLGMAAAHVNLGTLIPGLTPRKKVLELMKLIKPIKL